MQTWAVRCKLSQEQMPCVLEIWTTKKIHKMLKTGSLYNYNHHLFSTSFMFSTQTCQRLLFPITNFLLRVLRVCIQPYMLLSQPFFFLFFFSLGFNYSWRENNITNQIDNKPKVSIWLWFRLSKRTNRYEYAIKDTVAGFLRCAVEKRSWVWIPTMPQSSMARSPRKTNCPCSLGG